MCMQIRRVRCVCAIVRYCNGISCITPGYMTVAMPIDGGEQQQVHEPKHVARDEQEQEREEHRQEPTLSGFRSNCTTPEWNAVHGGVAQSHLGQSLQKRETIELCVLGEGGSVF